MAEPSDNPCSSEDDEYSDPLEVTASAGAGLSTPEKASISLKRKVQTNPASTAVGYTSAALKRSQIGLLQSKRSCWCILVQHELNECLAFGKMHLASSKMQH